MKKLFVNNIGDMASIQRSSYFRFLNEGISEELENFVNPLIVYGQDQKDVVHQALIYFFPGQIKLSNPLATMKMCLKRDLDYTIDVYVSSEFSYLFPSDGDSLSVEKTKEILQDIPDLQDFSDFPKTKMGERVAPFSKKFKSKKKLAEIEKKKFDPKVNYKQDILFAEIPLMTDEGTFILNGCERIVISQIIRSPGVYFRKEFGKTSEKTIYTATLISNRGVWTKFVYDTYIHKEKKEKGKKAVETKWERLYIKLNEFKRKSSYPKEKKSDTRNKLFLFDLLYYFDLEELYEIANNENFETILRSQVKETIDSLKYPFLFYQMIQKDHTNPWCRNPRSETRILDMMDTMYFNPRSGCFSIGEIGRYKLNKRLNLNIPKEIVHLTSYDFLEIINGLMELKYADRPNDDIDDIKNKLIRSVGDLLQIQFRVGLYRLKLQLEERSNRLRDMYNEFDLFSKEVNRDAEIENVFDTELIDPRIVTGSIREFFKTSQLSQYMDQTNPLAELTHKRRISVFGPNGLKRDHISTVIRDIHPSQYGRLCPIETPEGENAGLITSLALLGRVNLLGTIETPYFFMDKNQVYSSQRPLYLDPEQESETKIAFGDISFDSSRKVTQDFVSIKENYMFSVKRMDEVNFLTTSPLQIVSLATSLIPFLEHDDANRALMGSNMQRQAVPLLYTQKPIVGTGLEAIALLDSGMVIKSFAEGIVSYSSSVLIEIEDLSHQKIAYFLRKYHRSNQETSWNQKPLVWLGEKVFSGQIIADGSASNDGELALGRNLLIGYLPWEGYNYEDAIVINERILVDDCLTSVHIEEYETKLGYNAFGNEKRTRKLKHLTKYVRRHLDKRGIVRKGSYVRPYDILVGKLIPYEEDTSPERKLLKAVFKHLFQEKEMRDTSLKVSAGTEGRVIDIRIFRNNFYSQPSDQRRFQLVGNSNPLFSTYQRNRLGRQKQKERYLFILAQVLFWKKRKEEEEKFTKQERHKKRLKEKELANKGRKKHKRRRRRLQEMTIRIYIAQIRKIQVGDKLAGRHGNKGIISRVLSRQDMPYLPDGTPLDILFNPLGVPSRMNVGQVFECLLGLAGQHLGSRFKVFPFDEIYGKEASRILVNQKLKEAVLQTKIDWLFEPTHPGKILLRDGRTGEYFDNPITVGKSYILKLIHLVEDKIHARSTGPYAMITEQPLAGKAQRGGQRFGEMEVWALEAYGCSHTLQELLTVKSDDIDGRNDMYESLLVQKKMEKPNPSIPESFLTLIRELNSLGLDFSSQKIDFPHFEKAHFKEEIEESEEKTEETISRESSPFSKKSLPLDSSGTGGIQKIDFFNIVETRLQIRALLNRRKAEQYTKMDPNLSFEEKQKLEEKKKEYWKLIETFRQSQNPI